MYFPGLFPEIFSRTVFDVLRVLSFRNKGHDLNERHWPGEEYFDPSRYYKLFPYNGICSVFDEDDEWFLHCIPPPAGSLI